VASVDFGRDSQSQRINRILRTRALEKEIVQHQPADADYNDNQQGETDQKGHVSLRAAANVHASMKPMLIRSQVYHGHGAGLSRRSIGRKGRTQSGSQISEFGAGLILLIACAVLPLLDLIVVPIRWMLAQEIVNSYVRTLARCETLTDSFKTMDADPSLS